MEKEGELAAEKIGQSASMLNVQFKYFMKNVQNFV